MKNRLFRLLSAVVALLAVLFSQLVVAAYACPGADAMRAAVVVEAEPPCDQHPSQEAPAEPLCAAHCQQGDLSLDHRSIPVAGAATLAMHGSWLAPRVWVGDVPVASGEQLSLLERPTGPPLAVRHCRLRI